MGRRKGRRMGRRKGRRKEMADQSIEEIFTGREVKYTPEMAKRCITTMTRVISPSGAWLIDLFYGVPGEYKFIHCLVRTEEEARSEVETFKLRHRGESMQ
jgi:hypothetical protein